MCIEVTRVSESIRRVSRMHPRPTLLNSMKPFFVRLQKLGPFWVSLMTVALLGTFLLWPDEVKLSESARSVPSEKTAKIWSGVSSEGVESRLEGASALEPLNASSVSNAKPLFQLARLLEKPEVVNLPPKGVPIPFAALQVRSSSLIAADSVPSLSLLKEGETVQLPTPEGGWLQAKLTKRTTDRETGAIHVSGYLEGRHTNVFSLSQSGASFTGMMLDRANDRAFKIETASDGRVLLQEKPLNSLLCAKMPKEPFNRIVRRQSGPVAALTVPILDSLPSADSVLYLDFDGETVTDPLWPSEISGGPTIVAQPATIGGRPITEAEITAVWDAVAEDFRPFNISVTTSKSRYQGASLGERMRCIVTPTNDAAPDAGGVAYLNSFAEAGSGQLINSVNIPCWSFNEGNVRTMAMTISHELGHTLGLSHDGFQDSEGRQEYYAGHGTGVTAWGALMGAPFGRPVTQWSKGEYTGANNTEDDLAIITSTANGFGFRPDDVGNTPGTARKVSDLVFGTLNDQAVISEGTDVDYHQIDSGAGPLNATVTPLTSEPNVDILLELRDSTNALLASANPTDSLSATISRSLALGVYYLVVKRTATGTPLAASPTGFTEYGSLGGYRISGNFTPLPLIPTITVQPVAPVSAIVEGKAVTFGVEVLSNSAVTYQWIKRVGMVDQLIPGAKAKTYRIAAVNATHLGDYRVRVTNKAGSVESDSVNLDVVLKPRITVSPFSSTFVAGTDQALSVVVTGSPTLSLQWFKNNQLLPGENSETLSLTGVTWEDAGSYRLEATNSVGKAVSKTAVIKINSPPVFRTDPALFAVATGSRAILSFLIAGNPTFRYQWFKDEVAIPGATKSSLSIAGVPTSLGVYKLQVTNAFGTATSNGTTLTIDDKLIITEHPLGGASTAGSSHLFNVETSGSGPISYEWQQNRKSVLGGNGKNLSLNPLTWFHNGKYRVVVSNRVSRVTSRETTLSVSSAPVITVEPNDLKGARNGSITFSVTAVGTSKITYQWRKDGNPIPKAIGSKLTLTRLSDASQGNYDVLVTNPLGTTPSRSASLVVEDAPSIVVHPQPAFFSVGADLVLTVTTAGSPTLRYQWQKGTKDLIGQTNPTLTIPNAQIPDSASYRVVVTNDVGRVISKAAAVKILIVPSIVTQPQPVSVIETQTAVFTVKVGGTGPFKYRWLFGTTQVSTAATLTLTNVALTQAGNYTVEVSSPVGVITSDPALLTVTPVPAPFVSSFTPTRGPSGTKVAISGTGFQFAKSVTLSGQAMGFVISSNNEIVATVPSRATTGLIRVTSKGAAALFSQGSEVFTVAFNANNDNFEDSAVVTGGSVSESVNTVSYTAEVNEPPHAVGLGPFKSAWWRWTAPASGSYQITANSSDSDTILGVYTGGELGDLTPIASNDDSLGTLNSLVVISANAGTTYRIALDDFRGTGGSMIMQIRGSSRAPLAASDFEEASGFKVGESVAGKGAWQGDADSVEIEAIPGGQSARLGGGTPENGEHVQVWYPLVPDSVVNASQVVASFTAGLEIPEEDPSSDTFAWTIYNSDQEPLLALNFDSASRTFQMVNAAGEVWRLDQALVSGSMHRFEISTNFEVKTWGLTFDGVPVFEGLPLGVTTEKADFKDLSASWIHSQSGRPVSMMFDDLILSTEEP